MSKNNTAKATQQATQQTTATKQPAFSYSVGSNVVTLDGKQIYLTKILWDENLSYDDIKEYISE